ncbi:putative zinc-binding dehydrogenase family oxidoreductase [Arthroderma uncinatum]|uniref:putative zinc-binding dehydrogenase family oxidoreductase n=1 Tax=Arthroderma uncinatum TaxID=74035 RepID=UPI00144A97EF|nr:putative zinc-binding dehydrogenase family oxidoreductase [Arthroderma uncinatum]KAF3480349.1 putative zinc-binding dehydrogenase family oxidoreductase [Arthroderma uncinatum]
MDTLPKLQTAIVGREGGGLILTNDVPLPELEDDMVLVKNVAIAINPVDTKMAAPHLVTPGAVAGHDFAGTVVAMGKNVWTAANISIGDRGLHNLSPRVGAYAEYVGATDVVLMKVPDSLSFEQAASLGTGIGTMGLALFHNLGVPGYPTKPAAMEKTVLVYGGSTASGTLALQLLKLSGLKPITTCSPSNFELVKSYGAAETFDYRSKNCVEQIKKHTRNSLKYVIDCVSEPETMEFCYQCMGRSGGKLVTLEPPPKYLNSRPKTIKTDWVLGPALHGKAIGWPEPMTREPAPELKEFAKSWFTTVQELLDQGKLKTHPLRVMDGGFPAILDGLELLKTKQVSGQKLIYRL